MSRRMTGSEKKEENVAIAIDRDKGSQYALKWAVDNFLSRGQTLTLIHVNQPSGQNDDRKQMESRTKELFLPFRCFCSRKDISCNEVILEDTDISKAIIEYVTSYTIEHLVLGAPNKSGLVKRFKNTSDIPGIVTKGAPDFCNIYVIGKGKISAVRSATAPAPVRANPTPCNQLLQRQTSNVSESFAMNNQKPRVERSIYPPRRQQLPEDDMIRSPFMAGRAHIPKYEPSIMSDSDISFVSSGRLSTERPSTDSMFLYDYMDAGRLSTSSEFEDRRSLASSSSGNKATTMSISRSEMSLCSLESEKYSWSSQSNNNQSMEDVEAEMRRLRLELKQTMDMYNNACKEALSAKTKAMELHRWKLEEERKIEEARLAEEAAMAIAERERAKCKAAIEAAEAAQRIAELESQKRKDVEMRVIREAERNGVLKGRQRGSDLRYRRYTIEEIEEATGFFANTRKIGEGGYGPVFRGKLDHTSVAIKVLRPDAAEGKEQFHQEVEVLCNIRHPNMVLLLGACPEYGCLVYEYMAKGSLEDSLFPHAGTPVLPWQLRFRIAAEIATGLLFLHNAKPEPLVHRDLKPANILLDQNYVSKISDVGLARLVPPSVADTVTQYRMTSTAGTFCYIDPEYQQTGMLGIKSDVYSFGITLLQIITAKPPMGLTHHVERSIENGTFEQMLDPSVHDWPVEEALSFAKLALQCAEMRQRDRPDLGEIVLPELERLRELAEQQMPSFNFVGSGGSSPCYSQASMSDVHSGCSSSTSSYAGRRHTGHEE